MDKKDKIILKLLSKNARVPIVEIAKKIGISDVAVRKRIKRMGNKGIISGYTIKTDFKSIGYVVSLTGIDLEKDALLNVVEKLKEHDFIHAVYITTGDHSIIVSVWAEDSDQLTKYHKKIEKIKGVKRICPSVILERVK